MATKLLLIDDVEDLGRSGDIVSVKPGYARNRLIPMGAAIIADKNALKRQALLQQERVQKAADDKLQAEAVAREIEGKTIATHVKVDHDGRMYGSVSISDIAHLMQEQYQLQMEKRWVQLKQPIKKTGIHNIVLKLPEGVTCAFHLKVLAEGDDGESLTADAAE